MTQTNLYHSTIDPIYLKGDFYNRSNGDWDADYKVQQIKSLLQRNKEKINTDLTSVADIGCGTGKTTILFHRMLSDLFKKPICIDGYDVHPYMSQLKEEKDVRFYSGDFCTIAHEKIYDLAIMLDVIEHVPDPISFIHNVSKSARIIAFHIPLDDSLLSWVRNIQRGNLSHPGHIIVLDASAALNLLTFSGLRIIDFAFSPVFRAPSGKKSLAQRLINPIREIMYRISPFLTQKTLAGVSLTILTWTPYALATQ